MEVPHLGRDSHGIEAVVRVHPAIVRTVVALVAADDADSPGRGELNLERRHRARVLPLACDNSRALAADRFEHPQRHVAIFVAHVCDAPPVRRPARGRRIEVAECQRELRIAGERREPQLMPLTTLVAAVEHPPAIRRDLGARAPAGFFVQEALHPPGPVGGRAACIASAVSDLAIRDEYEALAVRRPRRIDRVIVLRVVVTRDLALVRRDDCTRRPQPDTIERRDEQVEVTVAGRRYVRQSRAVGRIARLDVDCVRRRQLLRRA